MTDPTITGFFRKPRRNCQRGLVPRRIARRTRRRGPFRVRADDTDIEAPRGGRRRRAMANAPRLGKFRINALAADKVPGREASAFRDGSARFEPSPRAALRPKDVRDARHSPSAAGRRVGADDAPFSSAVHRHAGRRGGQYRAAIGDAGDRPRNRHRRSVDGDGLYLVGGIVGAARSFLGAQERRPWAQAADPDGRRRVHRLDGAVRS